ncbi:hypothetical protein C4544_01545 [candidate division WS5 bacterium]|uniref:Uncharacterized protein n=1 Tax=candidate division WS5 bacterium TaxID=2093353 RepID=A0A419DFD7_9BACT|nr:MAG: hypothetical protein C4544_01545 [candidate division WS5 bacterium]
MATMNPFLKKKYLKIGVLALFFTIVTAFYPLDKVITVDISNFKEQPRNVDIDKTPAQGKRHFYYGFPLQVKDNIKDDFLTAHFIYNYLIWFGAIALIISLYEYDKFEILIKRKEINKKGEK